MAFHPYPQVIAAVFNRRAFGPPRGLTPASACPRIAHPASRPRRGTQVALLRLAFAPAPFRLTSPRASDSLAHSTKGTPSHPQRVLRLLVGARFQVLFHSPPGVLFTFPSRYWYAIGQTGMLRLTQRSGLIHAGFHEARATWDNTIGRRLTSRYGAGTLYGQAFKPVPLASRFMTPARPVGTGTRDPTTPATQPPTGITRNRFGLIRFRSPLLTEYPFLQVLRCFTSLRTPRP